MGEDKMEQLENPTSWEQVIAENSAIIVDELREIKELLKEKKWKKQEKA